MALLPTAVLSASRATIPYAVGNGKVLDGQASAGNSGLFLALPFPFRT
jgi:hypothetical protein